MFTISQKNVFLCDSALWITIPHFINYISPTCIAFWDIYIYNLTANFNLSLFANQLNNLSSDNRPLKDVFRLQSFKQIVNEPTRTTKEISSTLFDIIYTNKKKLMSHMTSLCLSDRDCMGCMSAMGCLKDVSSH